MPINFFNIWDFNTYRELIISERNIDLCNMLNMNKIVIKPYNVVDNTDLLLFNVDKVPAERDPIEINGEMYYVCEKNYGQEAGFQKIGVIPLVVRNPAKVLNIQNYIKCLSIAHRRLQFTKNKKICDLDNCDEMIIS